MGEEEFRRMAALLPGQQAHPREGGKKRAAQSQDVPALHAVEAHQGAKCQRIHPKCSGEAPHIRKQGRHVAHGIRHGRIQGHAHRQQPAYHHGPEQQGFHTSPQFPPKDCHCPSPPS